MNNKGIALLETVISVTLTTVILINIFVIVNAIINKNDILYETQKERNENNNIYTKIGQDLYKYNIKSAECNSNTCKFIFYTTDANSTTSKELKIVDKNIVYDNKKLTNTNKYNSINININNKVLKTTIYYGEYDNELNFYSINYKG